MIKTVDDWWRLVDENWEDLCGIIGHQMRFGYPIEFLEGIEFLEEIEFLRLNKNKTLVRYFHSAWGSASDCYARSNPPGWSVLCDLCSEDYVLYEDGNDEY